jgi:hypothetical protein
MLLPKTIIGQVSSRPAPLAVAATTVSMAQTSPFGTPRCKVDLKHAKKVNLSVRMNLETMGHGGSTSWQAYKVKWTGKQAASKVMSSGLISIMQGVQGYAACSFSSDYTVILLGGSQAAV